MDEQLVIGQVFCSRNLKDSDNRKSAVINHNCILVDENTIVEAQKGQGVIRTSLADYKKRAYNYFVLYPRDKELGKKAAENAKALVGKKYGIGSSYRPRLYSGKLDKLSCCSVVDLAYSQAVGDKLHLKNTDDIFKRTELFTTDINQSK